MKLELKHLAPYLPYGLKAMNTHRDWILDLKGLQTDLDVIHNHGKTPIRFIKPILRPLSDLTKEIEHNGERFVPIKEIGDEYFRNLKKVECDGEIFYGWDEYGFDDAQGYQFSFSEESMNFGVWYDAQEEGEAPIYSIGGYNDMVKLFEWHFDVFGLIDKGLAINLNSLQ